MTFVSDYLAEIEQICRTIDPEIIEQCVDLLVETRDNNGRVFVLGVGGSAANASHAVNDLRKMAGIEAYAPTDNVAELTARTNDNGWITTFNRWLRVSKLRPTDLILVLSVGGGNIKDQISMNIVAAVMYAHEITVKIIGIIGKDDGYTASIADACVIVPNVNSDHITQHAETFQSAICHLLVSHPKLKP